MADLKIKNIDNNLYNILKSLAQANNHPVSEEAARILEQYLLKKTV